MKKQIVYVITDGEMFKAFCGSRRTKWKIALDERSRAANGKGNPYLVYGPAIKQWLGCKTWDNVTINVAHITSGSL